MTRRAPRSKPALSAAAAVALAALIAVATGGAGLAHRVLAHGGHAQAGAPGQQTRTSGTTACCHHAPASTPSDEPAAPQPDHDCQVCTLLAASFAPTAPHDALPGQRLVGTRLRLVFAAAPAARPRTHPPVRGPPSRSA